MSGARVRCHRCGQWLGVIDWSDPAAPLVSDRIVAGHAIVCIPPRRKPQCKIPGCDKDVRARGWCKKHWTRWSRHGDPTADAATSRRRQPATPRPQPMAAPVVAPPVPEPVVEVKPGVAPSLCPRCGHPYAADARLPVALLRAALAVHRCQREAA